MESGNLGPRCRKSNRARGLYIRNAQEIFAICTTLDTGCSVTHNTTGVILVRTGHLQGIFNIYTRHAILHMNRRTRFRRIKPENATHRNHVRRCSVVDFTVELVVRSNKMARSRHIVITRYIQNTKQATHGGATRNFCGNNLTTILTLGIDIQLFCRTTNGLVKSYNTAQSRLVPSCIVMNIDLNGIADKGGIFFALRTDCNTRNTAQEHVMTSRLQNFLGTGMPCSNRYYVRNVDIVVTRNV